MRTGSFGALGLGLEPGQTLVALGTQEPLDELALNVRADSVMMSRGADRRAP